MEMEIEKERQREKESERERQQRGRGSRSREGEGERKREGDREKEERSARQKLQRELQARARKSGKGDPKCAPAARTSQRRQRVDTHLARGGRECKAGPAKPPAKQARTLVYIYIYGNVHLNISLSAREVLRW